MQRATTRAWNWHRKMAFPSRSWCLSESWRWVCLKAESTELSYSYWWWFHAFLSMMSVSQNHHPKPMFSVHSSRHRGPPPQKSTTECRKGRHFVKWLCVRYIATQMWFWAALHLGIYKKTRPFNHIFGGDRNLRAWYRGIKNAGPRKRAQGRAQDIPYQSISPYHHGIWRIFIECGKKPHARKSAQGRSARGPILPKSNRNFRQPPFDKFATQSQNEHRCLLNDRPYVFEGTPYEAAQAVDTIFCGPHRRAQTLAEAMWIFVA